MELNNTSDSVHIHQYPLLQWSLGFSYAVITTLSLIGNTAVIAAVCVFTQLRTVTHYLLMSLAAADLTVTVLVMPFALIYDVSGEWHQGRTFCLFWMSWDVMCCTASLQHLCVIAWDRYVAITDPFCYTNRMSLLRVLILIIFIWINSALISFLPIFMNWFTKSDLQLAAHPQECFLETNPYYAVASASISFYVPLFGMAFCYSRILSIAWQKVQQTNEQMQSVREKPRRTPKSFLQLPHLHHAEHHSHKRSTHLRDLKATKTLGIIFGMFFCCWWPFFIVYWLDAFLKPGFITQTFRSLITWLGYLNCCVNPIIYSWNPVFRAAYKKLFLYLVKPCRRDFDSISMNGMLSLSNTHDTLGKRSSLRHSSICTSEHSINRLGQPNEEEMKELELLFWPPSTPIFIKNGIKEEVPIPADS